MFYRNAHGCFQEIFISCGKKYFIISEWQKVSKGAKFLGPLEKRVSFNENMKWHGSRRYSLVVLPASFCNASKWLFLELQIRKIFNRTITNGMPHTQHIASYFSPCDKCWRKERPKQIRNNVQDYLKALKSKDG